jgi:hypothetical protein
MKTQFTFHSADHYHRATPYLTALMVLQDEEEKTKWRMVEGVTLVSAEKEPETPTSQAASPSSGSAEVDPLAGLFPAPATEATGGSTVTDTDPLLAIAASSSTNAVMETTGAAPSPDPLAAMAAASAATTEPATASSSSSTVNPLDALVASAPAQQDFVVFTVTGEKRAGYANASDAAKVFAHDIGEITTSADIENLWRANQPLYERLDRGGKMSMSKAHSKRKEELAAILSALMGSTPAEPETGDPGMTQQEFFDAFTKLASLTGAQAVVHITKVFSEFGVTTFGDIPPAHWRKALDMIQQVVDNKGK